MRTVRVGVVGFCPPTIFNPTEAKRLIATAFDEIARHYADCNIIIVSGMTDLGIPGLAYHMATERGWTTSGILCRRRVEKYAHALFPVDESIVIEDEGQESATFVGSLDAILRFGGGEQSLRETAAVKSAGKLTFEYDLATL